MGEIREVHAEADDGSCLRVRPGLSAFVDEPDIPPKALAQPQAESEVSTAAVGKVFYDADGGELYLKQFWVIATTHTVFRDNLAQFSAQPEEIAEKQGFCL